VCARLVGGISPPGYSGLKSLSGLVVLVLWADRVKGFALSTGNLVDNGVTTVVVAAWEGGIDRAKAHAVLDGREAPVLG
jgi:Na+/H+-dicarboxylate symporter